MEGARMDGKKAEWEEGCTEEGWVGGRMERKEDG